MPPALAQCIMGVAGPRRTQTKGEDMSERDHAVDTRAGIGSDAWIDALRSNDNDAMDLDDLDVHQLTAEQAARLWARLAAWVETDQMAYNVDDAPVSSDAAYDARLRCLQRLESAFPQLDTPQSSTHRVGGTFSNEFASVRHPSRMMSLDDVFSYDELRAWYNSVLRDLDWVPAARHTTVADAPCGRHVLERVRVGAAPVAHDEPRRRVLIRRAARMVHQRVARSGLAGGQAAADDVRDQDRWPGAQPHLPQRLARAGPDARRRRDGRGHHDERAHVPVDSRHAARTGRRHSRTRGDPRRGRSTSSTATACSCRA